VLTPNEYDNLPIDKQNEYMDKSIKEYGEFELTLEN